MRILTALRDLLTSEIDRWSRDQPSRDEMARRWEVYLLGDDCARGELACEACDQWAHALGYVRAGGRGWERPAADPTGL